MIITVVITLITLANRSARIRVISVLQIVRNNIYYVNDR